MASARDQVEAYGFAARRQVLALLRGDETQVLDPRRRLNRSTVVGVLLAVVALAVVGVAGFLSDGGASTVPKDGVIVDATTGGTFVLADGVLHPTLNLASAKLVGGRTVTTVSSESLDRLSRGLPVGIAGAPNALPDPARLTTGPWSACVVAARAADAQPDVVLSVGAAVPRRLGTASGVAVTTPDGTVWLIEQGLRYRVTPAAGTLLGLDRVTRFALPAAVLDVVPEGPALRVPEVPDAGTRPAVDLPFDAEVGDLVEVDLGSRRPGRYVVLSDGVAPVDPFAFALLAGAAAHTRTVPARDVVDVASRRTAPVPPLWPRAALSLADPPAAGAPLCLTYDPSAPTGRAPWTVTTAEPATPPRRSAAVEVDGAGATAVSVPAGGGVLVRGLSTGRRVSVLSLVTDSGLRFPIADGDAVERLGYTPADAVDVPLPYLDLLPSGPALDPAAAARQYSGTSTSPAPSASP